MTFGVRIREAREAHGLTASQLSRLLGVSQGHISRIEAGQCPPPGGAVLEEWTKILEVDLDELHCLAGRIPEELREWVTACPENMRKLRELFSLDKGGGSIDTH